MPPDETWCLAKADATLNPQRTRNALSRLSEAWPADLPALSELFESFPLGEDALLHLLAFSPIATEKIMRDPQALVWLSDPMICASDRPLWHMKVDLRRASADQERFDPGFRELHRQKAREMLRIAVRELTAAAPLPQTALELSFLAELCVSEIYTAWFRELSSRWGQPDSRFSVLGLGKFGGGELNYSSDIDVIFLCSRDGQLNRNFTYQQFYTRLAEKIIASFSAANEFGMLFRIDLRLRPDGNSGPLVRTMESMEHYYTAYGETWERMMLIKAKPVAGDPELGYEFLRNMQPFIYPRHLNAEHLREISALKQRIDTELVGADRRNLEIKRGYGGIREIEFVIQSLQLLNGAVHPFLQQPNTLKAIETLQSLGQGELLEKEHADTLAAAYHFLRKVEHRLQIVDEKQTHLLPSDEEALRELAASLGFDSVRSFRDRLGEITGGVHEVFESHFGDLPPAEGAEPDLSFFKSPKDAARRLTGLGGKTADGRGASPRTKRVFRSFKPILVRSLHYATEPDLVLNRMQRFVENYGIRATLFELLIQHPRLLELLTKLFDASSFVSEIAIRRPELVDEVARAGGLDHRMTADEYLESLDSIPLSGTDPAAVGDRLRTFRNDALLRIALRDVLELAPLDDILLEYTALSEACLVNYLRTTGAEDSLTVIAMGKFGARELSYGSDLDVLFIGSDIEPARKLLAEFKRASTEGTLDDVDARLRPEGRSGLLVCSLDAYRNYFDGRGELWEAQALTKARPVCGPETDAAMETIGDTWSRFGKDPALVAKVSAMLDRIHQERGAGDDFLHFKAGRGGLIDLEFAVQAHQMRAGLWETNTLVAARKLDESGEITTEAQHAISYSYQLLRRIAYVLRRQENRSVSSLPPDPEAQAALARRLGFSGLESFHRAYRNARESAATVTAELLHP